MSETASVLRQASGDVGETALPAAPRARLARDARIDTLRGLALVVMTGAHLPFPLKEGFPGWLGFASFTQVFIVLSGLVAGLVYAHRATEMSPRQVWTKALRRSAWIWLVHVAVIAFFAGYLFLLRALGSEFLPDRAEFLVARPGVGLVLAAAMLYLPGYTGILPMYVFFVALLPPTLLGLLRGRWILVLGTSLAVWFAAQLGARDALDLWLDDVVHHHLGHFDVLAWQLVFVVGVAIGVAWAHGALARWRPPVWALLGALLAHAALFCVRHDMLPAGAGPLSAVQDWIWSWSDSPKLGFFRALDFGLVLVLAGWLARRFPKWLTWRWLALIGRHSMTVFLFHLVLVYVLAPLEIASLAPQVAVSALALASLTLPAWAMERRPKRSTAEHRDR